MFSPQHNGPLCCCFFNNSSHRSLSTIVSQGRCYGARSNTCVAASLIADLRTAIDHASKGPCAERKARHCAASEEMPAGQRGEEKEKEHEGTGQSLAREMRVGWDNRDTCASLPF